MQIEVTEGHMKLKRELEAGWFPVSYTHLRFARYKFPRPALSVGDKCGRGGYLERQRSARGAHQASLPAGSLARFRSRDDRKRRAYVRGGRARESA